MLAFLVPVYSQSHRRAGHTRTFAMGDHKEKPGENKVQDDASFAEGRIQALPLNNASLVRGVCDAFRWASDRGL